MNKGTLNRRAFMGGAVAGGVLGYGGAEGRHQLDQLSDKPTQERAQQQIDRLQNGFDADAAFFANAAQPAESGFLDFNRLSRHEYLFTEFASKRARFMPAAIQQKLASLIPGVAAQENRFRSDRVSSAGAVGFMQFLMSTYRDLGGQLSLEGFRNNFPEQVEYAFKYFDEDIYRTLDDRANFRAIGQKYGVRGDELNTFIALSMVNAYKAGQTRMANVLSAFYQGFAPRSLPEDFDGTGLGLFHTMTRFMGNYNLVSGYGPQSREYPFLAAAGAQSLAERFDQPYGLKSSPAHSQGVLIGAAVGAVLTDAMLDPTFKRAPYAANVLGAVGKVPYKIVGETVAAVQGVLGRKGKSKLSKTAARLQRAKAAAAKPKPTKSRRRKASKAPGLNRRQVLAGAGAVAATGGYLFKDEILEGLRDTALEAVAPTYTRAEVPAEVARLNRRGIFLYSSTQGFNENGQVDGPGRTALNSMRRDVWAATEQFLEDLDLLDRAESPNDNQAIVVTGLAEDAGHSRRRHGHGPGFATDFRSSTADRISNRLVEDTSRINATSRRVEAEHRLRASGLLVGDQIFRYNSKYFLFGLQHEGRTWVVYFDAESDHRHFELIPWEDYNVNSRAEFVQLAQMNRGMGGIWREAVRDHIENHANAAVPVPWHQDFVQYMREAVDW